MIQAATSIRMYRFAVFHSLLCVLIQCTLCDHIFGKYYKAVSDRQFVLSSSAAVQLLANSFASCALKCYSRQCKSALFDQNSTDCSVTEDELHDGVIANAPMKSIILPVDSHMTAFLSTLSKLTDSDIQMWSLAVESMTYGVELLGGATIVDNVGDMRGGKALVLDGVDDHAAVRPPPVYDATSSMTVMITFKPTGGIGSDFRYLVGDWISPYVLRIFLSRTNGHICVEFRNHVSVCDSSVIIQENVVYTMAAVWNYETEVVGIWLDGVKIAEQPNGASQRDLVTNTHTSWSLGMHPIGNSEFFEGYINNFIVFTDAIADDDMPKLFI